MSTGLTVRQAAHAGRCSRSTIGGLVHRGRLKTAPGRRGQTSPFHILHTREEVRDIVAKLAPKSGYRARRRTPGEPRDPFTGARLNPATGRPVTNGASETHKLPASATSPTVATVLALAALPADKRRWLFQLGKRFTVAELEILATL